MVDDRRKVQLSSSFCLREKEVNTIVIEVKEVYNTTSYLKHQIP
jgi:hypothetical protein